MNYNLQVLVNFLSISIVTFLICYLLKYNKNLNLPDEKLVAVGLTAGLIYLIIVYLSKETFTTMGLKYFEDDTKNING